MHELITPLHFLILAVAGWLNEHQAKKIEFLCKQLEAYQRIAGTGRLPDSGPATLDGSAVFVTTLFDFG